MPWTCMLRCADGSYCVGSARDLDLRMEQHSSGDGAAHTKRRPVTLVYAEEFHRTEDAYVWEQRLQGWIRAKREAVIRGDWAALPALSRRRSRGAAPVDG